MQAKNHAEAIDWLQDFAIKKKPITQGFLKDLNALLHKGITELPARGAHGEKIMRPITPGAYKKQPNHVLTLSGEIHYYVEPLKVPDEMEKLIKIIREKETTAHPVELAAQAHYEIVRIHPFDDCNGRGARILTNLILMRAAYPPVIIKTEERRKYLELLETADKNVAEPFYVFISEHVISMLQQ